MPFDPWRLVRSAWFWVLLALAVLLIWLAAARFLGFGDVFCLSDGCQLERARERLERTESDLSARNEEAEGRQAVQQEAERSHTIILETRTITTQAVAEAYGAPDADTPLDPERADRLRRADERLCAVADSACVPAEQY